MAEIQFGESSSGAAIVQGTFLGADQGGPRSQGMPGQRGNGGNSKQTLDDGKNPLPLSFARAVLVLTELKLQVPS